MPRLSLLLALLLSVASSLSHAASAAKTHEFILANGLKVLVREDHRAPVVVSQLWYKVGSSYELPGQSGLSHALEHMMFKGSSKLEPGESSRILRELGAEENAFTSSDFTAYYQVLSSDRLAIALEMEADRMATLRLPADEFAKEIEVIKEERRLRTDDNPNRLAYERFLTLAYPASSYRIPTVGWMDDLKRMQIGELRDWYQQWYAPNNATLVVVGDVQAEQVKALAERFFGPIPARAIPPAKRPLELAEPGERFLTLHVRTQLPSVLLGFNVPSLATAANPSDAHALRLTSALLDGGYSSRIPTRLEREQELIAGGGSSYDAFKRGDSLFTLSAVPNVQKQRTLADVEAGLWAELDALKQTPPSAEELARVRAQVIAGLVYERDSITSQAMTLGSLETVGLSWTLMDEDLAALEAVTPADIQRVAQTYFTRSRLTRAHVLPEHEASHD